MGGPVRVTITSDDAGATARIGDVGAFVSLPWVFDAWGGDLRLTVRVPGRPDRAQVVTLPDVGRCAVSIHAPSRSVSRVGVADAVTLTGYALGLWWCAGGPAWAALLSVLADEADGRIARARGVTKHGNALDWGADVALTPLALGRLGRDLGARGELLIAAPPLLAAQAMLRADGVRPEVGSARAMLMLLGVAVELGKGRE